MDRFNDYEYANFMGAMVQWKYDLSKQLEDNFDVIFNKLDTFATKKQLEEARAEIRYLHKRVNQQRWAILVLFAILTCGELAVHHLEWILAMIK